MKKSTAATTEKTLNALDLSQIQDPHARQAIRVLLNLVEVLQQDNRTLREENQRLRDENIASKASRASPRSRPIYPSSPLRITRRKVNAIPPANAASAANVLRS